MMKSPLAGKKVLNGHSGHNLIEIQRDYLIRIVEEVPGRKVLVLDESTMEQMSMLVAQSELLQREVYLVELLAKIGKEKDLDSINTIIIVDPVAQNINMICNELTGFGLTNCYICTTLLTDRFHCDCRRPILRTTGHQRC